MRNKCNRCNYYNGFSDFNEFNDFIGQSYEDRYGNERCRDCELYWQGFLAGFYSNNKCNRLLWTHEECECYKKNESQKDYK